MVGRLCSLRPYRPEDVDALVRNANDPEVARGLTDRFPVPYTEADAREWISACENRSPGQEFLAVEVQGEAAGGVGFGIIDEVHPRTAMIGYWLGRRYWNRGIMTEAVTLATAHAFENRGVIRMEAGVYPWNKASTRVLEKAGYQFETILRARLFKAGQPYDEHFYAKIAGG
ncbi:MAG: GNAT family N-acetyltransferase [Deltaproteobacteria bacterium]|nr:GNAT family N-acetyltransferase [Deltaproteobacteria bacterium]